MGTDNLHNLEPSPKFFRRRGETHPASTIKNGWTGLEWADATSGCVHGQLADWDADAPIALVPEAQDGRAVGNHHHPHILQVVLKHRGGCAVHFEQAKS